MSTELGPVRRLLVTVPVRTPNVANGSHGAHWASVARLRKSQRQAAFAYLLRASCDRPKLPLVVTLTRHSAGRLDAHDGLPASLKSIVDGAADYLGISDNDSRIRWVYRQASAPRGTSAVVIDMCTREESAE